MRSIKVFSMPCFRVTSTMPQPWQPPPKRRRTTPSPGDFLQRHLALVRGQLRIDLGIEQLRTRSTSEASALGRLALDPRRADGQLAAGRPWVR